MVTHAAEIRYLVLSHFLELQRRIFGYYSVVMQDNLLEVKGIGSSCAEFVAGLFLAAVQSPGVSLTLSRATPDKWPLLP